MDAWKDQNKTGVVNSIDRIALPEHLIFFFIPSGSV